MDTLVFRRDEPLDDLDLQYCAERMNEYIQAKGGVGHPLSHFATSEGLFNYLKAIQTGATLESYWDGEVLVGILGYAVLCPIWTDRLILKEMTMFLFEKGYEGFGRACIQRLETVAKQKDCIMIEAGDSINSNTNMTRNLYIKKGKFTGEYPLYFKKI